MANYSYLDLAKMIDHSLLVPTLTIEDLERGIDLAIAYDVASVCIMPYYLKRASSRLAGSNVKSSTTIGFPHGANRPSIKRLETIAALDDGCQELDVVVNISQVLSLQWDFVRDEIAMLTELAHDAGQKIKVIFENCYLQDLHKIELCRICSEVNVDWVKTSTGYGPSGATIEDLKLMRQHVAPGIEVKAAGGVRDLATLLAVRQLGVSRCGSSRTRELLDPARASLGLDPILMPTEPSSNNPNY
ncbi:MAG: deoxyribose-phosphate aldolase [Planctomycetota bacterium]|nr:deoxyribose-phosphate aldolase [Planctomycetota bacterium]